MRAEYADLIRRRLDIPPSEGPDKTATLETAVANGRRRASAAWSGASIRGAISSGKSDT